MASRLDALVVGAGISGLVAARELSAAGLAVRVVERARGIGGRCAVRRLGVRPVDFGAPYLHARHPEFLEVLDEVSATPVEGWPVVREGGGLPCRPEAFQGRDRLLVYREGINMLAHHVARGLDISLRTEVRRLESSGPGSLRAVLSDGSTIAAPSVFLTPPWPHTASVLQPFAGREPALARILPVLDQVRYVPCLAVIARYAADVPHPPWDINLPRISSAVHSILNDSSKRDDGEGLVLVFQSGITYSRTHRGMPSTEWMPGLLAEAERLHGAWIGSPLTCVPHVWDYARVQEPTELSGPVLVPLANDTDLVLCGDAFWPSGGLEGAFLSGRRAARQWLERRAL